MLTGILNNLTRRNFVFGLAALGLTLECQSLVYKNNTKKSEADGLLHMRLNGKVDVYSGGGHHGVYSSCDTLKVLKRTLNFDNNDFVIIAGDNPDQLPGFLGQTLHHMSFTNAKTNQKAASILKQKFNNQGGNIFVEPSYIIDKGISRKTQKIINTLKPEGIIVAVEHII